MFEIGDLVEYNLKVKDANILIGLVETVSDGKVGVRWLNNKFSFGTSLTVFWALNNLQPLEKIENLKKGKKYEPK
jgi:hypothetical protein